MLKIGLDCGGTTLKLGVVENGLNILYRDTRPTPHDCEKLSDLMVEMIQDARKKYPHAPAAISAAGAMDENGCLDANQLGFFKEPLGPMVWKKTGRTYSHSE